MLRATLKNPKNVPDNTYGPRYAPQNLPPSESARRQRSRLCCSGASSVLAQQSDDTAAARSGDRGRPARAPRHCRRRFASRSCDTNRLLMSVEPVEPPSVRASGRSRSTSKRRSSPRSTTPSSPRRSLTSLATSGSSRTTRSCRPSSSPTKSRCGWSRATSAGAALRQGVEASRHQRRPDALSRARNAARPGARRPGRGRQARQRRPPLTANVAAGL